MSAVEATLKVLTELEHADLAVALREFTRTNPIHGALFVSVRSAHARTEFDAER